MNIGILVYGDFSFAQGLVLIINCSLSLLIAFIQTIIVAKGILIFHEVWIAEVEDSTILWSSRRFTFVYSALRLVIDLNPESRPLPLIEMLSGSSEKRFDIKLFGSRFGFAKRDYTMRFTAILPTASIFCHGTKKLLFKEHDSSLPSSSCYH